MWSECLEVFQHLLDEYGEKLILDDYIPADGTYLLVNQNGDYEISAEIKLDKKSGIFERCVRHEDICYFDYYSKIQDMNKPIDKKKIIQSNNYLSFVIKKESLTNGKLTDGLIDEYYRILENPYLKYSSGTSKRLYQSVEDKLGTVDIQLLNKHKQWIKENIWSLNIDNSGKNGYLKIYFDVSKELYEKEGSRYFIPNIYNNNEYNIEVEGQIYGVSNNNLGMNSKKPYLGNRTKKVSTPYLIDENRAFLQKQFMDYLMNFAMRGENNIFIDYERKEIKAYKNTTDSQVNSGYFLRIQKGKEVEIHYQSIIIDGNDEIESPLEFKNHLKVSLPTNYTEKVSYKEIFSKKELQYLLDEVFFYKCLSSCLFTPVDKISINNGVLKTSLVMCREKIFSWVTLGSDEGIEDVLNRASKNLVKDAIESNFLYKAIAQFNLRWSLKKYFEYAKGEMCMERDISDYYEMLSVKLNSDTKMKIESDEEFYYGVGQLVRFLISLNKSALKTHSLANPFFNASEVSIIKQRLKQMFKKYNYNIMADGKRFNRLYEMISMYQPNSGVNDDMMIAGYLSDSLIYEKRTDKKVVNHEEDN